MNCLVTLLVITPSLLLAISLADSPAPHSRLASASQQPSVSTAPTQSAPDTPTLSPSSFPSVPGSYAVAQPSEKPPSTPSAPPETFSSTPSVVSSAASPSPVLEEQVFIPLKEWKQRKLQHIELRVRNGQARPSPSPNPSPRAEAQCPLPRQHLPIFLLTRVCSAHERTGLVNATNESRSLHTSASAQKQTNSNAQTAQTSSTARARHSKLTNSPSSTLSHSRSHQHLSSSSPSATAKHANIPIRVTVSVVPSNLPTDELFESDLRPPSIRSGLSIPMRLPKVVPRFGAIVRSIIDASYLFSASSFPPSLTTRSNSNSSHKLSTANNTNSSWPQRTPASNRVRPSLPNANKRSNSNSNFERASKPTKTPAVDNSADHDTSLQYDAQRFKEKPFNFASADAGARVLAHSEGVVGAKNVLIGSVDKYLLAPCDGPGLMGSRWIDLELSEDVILESIETANFEYYSSSARKVAVLGASAYPPKRWNILGVFDFQNVKSIQRFQISKRVVTRFLRLMYTGKQGNEYYCPVSTIRAFGKNLIADWKDVFDAQSEDDDPVQSPSANVKNRKAQNEGVASRELNDHHQSGESDSIGKVSSDVVDGDKEPTEDSSTAHGASQARMTGTDHQENINSNSRVVTHVTSQTDDGPVRDAHSDSADAIAGDQSESHVRDDKSRSSEGGGKVQANEEDQDEDSDLISEDDRIVMEAVRTDALAPVSGEDNIFRKVTRMLRLLELNQTLTNQYIDSQLSRFARALASTHSRSGAVNDRVALVEKQMIQIVISLEARIDELLQANFARDVVICVLLICVAVMIVAHCVLWAAVSGAKLHQIAGERVIEGPLNSPQINTLFRNAEDVGSPITKDGFQGGVIPSPNKRKKKKTKKFANSARKERQEVVVNSMGNGINDQSGRQGRSVSSFELVSLPLTPQALPPSGRGAFGVLGSSDE